MWRVGSDSVPLKARKHTNAGAGWLMNFRFLRVLAYVWLFPNPSFFLPTKRILKQIMVLTPPFRIRQTESNIFIEVDIVKSENDTSLRVVVDNDNIFGLAGANAYLPLVFPQGVLCNGSAKWTEQIHFDESAALSLCRTNESSILISIRKVEPGKQIESLDTLKPSVFAVPTSGDAEQDEEERLAGLEMLQRGMEAVQKQEAEDAVIGNNKQPLPFIPKVGTEIKTRLHECTGELPPLQQRREQAERFEEEKWDEGMYLDSYVDEEGEIKHLVNASLSSDTTKAQNGVVNSDIIGVTEEEKRDAHLLLLDLLLAYSYDRRTTLDDPTVESGWTIAVLCRSLVASCMPTSIQGDTVTSILRTSIRRQLCFTLYRHWQLSLRIAADVSTILRQKDAPFAALQQVQARLEEGDDDALTIYGDSIIKPLVYWYDVLFTTQTLSSLADELDQASSSITKEYVGPKWDLELLEESAREAIAEGEGGFV
jgi:protein SHQ1